MRTANGRGSKGDRIVSVGLTPLPARPTRSSTAKGLVLAPGFIDIHNHSTSGLTRIRQPSRRSRRGSRPWRSARTASRPGPRAPGWPRPGRAGGRQRHGFVGHATVRRQVHRRRLQEGLDARRGPRRWRRSWTRRCGRAPWACLAASSTRSAATATRRARDHVARGGRAQGHLHVAHPGRGGPLFRGLFRGARDRRAGPGFPFRSPTSSWGPPACGAGRARGGSLAAARSRGQ